MDNETLWKMGATPVFKSMKIIKVQGKKMLQKDWAEANRITEASYRSKGWPLDQEDIQDDALLHIIKMGQEIEEEEDEGVGCHTCHGKGEIKTFPMYDSDVHFHNPCPRCNGTGKIKKESD